MAGNWTCNDCGSSTRNRKVDVTSVEDAAKQYETVPHVCSNRDCPNANPRNHSLAWFREA